MMNDYRNILLDLYPEWLTGAIFTELLDTYDVPWKTSFDGIDLDIEYFGNHSGSKIISPLLQKLLTEDGLSDENKSRLVRMIYNKYNLQWNKVWEVLNVEYNPIDNYNRIHKEEVVETEERLTNKDETGTNKENTTNSTTDNKNKTTKNTGTQTLSGQDSENLQATSVSERDTSHSYNSNTQNGIYGFDSGAASNHDKSDTTQGDTGSEDVNITDTSNNSYTKSNTTTNDLTETITDNNEISNTGNSEQERVITSTIDDSGNKTTITETTDRGNIGVTTSQQMIESEIELRNKYNFIEILFRDVDNILTIPNAYGTKQNQIYYN